MTREKSSVYEEWLDPRYFNPSMFDPAWLYSPLSESEYFFFFSIGTTTRPFNNRNVPIPLPPFPTNFDKRGGGFYFISNRSSTITAEISTRFVAIVPRFTSAAGMDKFESLSPRPKDSRPRMEKDCYKGTKHDDIYIEWGEEGEGRISLW